MRKISPQKNTAFMFDYIGEGNTFYDILGQYIPEVENDFSTTNLMIKLDDIPVINGRPVIDNFYNEIFNRIVNGLLNACESNKNGIKTTFPPSREEKLLGDLRQIDDTSDNDARFESLKEYLLYVKRNIDNPKMKPIKNEIIKQCIDILPQADIDKARYLILQAFYIPRAQEQLKREIRTYAERNESTEWKRLQDAADVLSNETSLRIYDAFLKEHSRKREEILKQQGILLKRQELIDRCEARRDYYITNELYATMSDEEKEKANEIGILNSILGNTVGHRPLQQGSYKWEFKKYKKPVIIFDGEAEYSENGVENQRVIAISYGSIDYKKRGDVDNHDGLELIGVTRIGTDQEKTYFVVTAFDKAKLVKDFEFDPDKDEKVDFYVDGRNSRIRDKDYQDYVLVKKDRITPEQREFFSKIFFSDLYLGLVEEFYNRYAGVVIPDGKGTPKITKDRLLPFFASDSEAVRYASNYPGVCGSGFATLEELCEQGGIIDELQRNMVDIVRNQPERISEYQDTKRQQIIAQTKKPSRSQTQIRKRGQSGRCKGEER